MKTRTCWIVIDEGGNLCNFPLGLAATRSDAIKIFVQFSYGPPLIGDEWDNSKKHGYSYVRVKIEVLK